MRLSDDPRFASTSPDGQCLMASDFPSVAGTGADHDREEDTLLEEVSTHFVQAAHSVSMRLGSHKEHAE